MLGRQIFTDNIVIRPGFQHFNAAPDTVDKPLDKLRNFAGPSCWFSALVLNDHITVTNRDSAVSFRFVLDGLEMIPFDVLWEPAFPCIHEFFFRVVITLCDFLRCIAEILNWSSFRTKPERSDAVRGFRCDLLQQGKQFIKQFLTFVVVDTACHTKVVISPEPADIPIYFWLRQFTMHVSSPPVSCTSSFTILSHLRASSRSASV